VLARIRAVLRTYELIHQIERREERIRVAEAIADRVLEYTDGLRQPLSGIIDEAKALEPECGTAKPFVDRARGDAEAALAKLDVLDAAVASLRAEADTIKSLETALPAIKTRYRGSPAQ